MNLHYCACCGEAIYESAVEWFTLEIGTNGSPFRMVGMCHRCVRMTLSSAFRDMEREVALVWAKRHLRHLDLERVNEERSEQPVHVF